ncbi:hypothetical protein Q5752_001501 [Cryptotrichosporon argae]
MPVAPVTVSYDVLRTSPGSLHQSIENALGSAPGCLGIILVRDLPPEFPVLRERLFRLAHRFANLPEATRERFARPDTSYLFGWSHGKEVMNGRPDRMKGSYYANPLLDRPDVDDAKRAAYPEYYAGNVWPSAVEGLADFEAAFKALGTLIADVGLALARACEAFVAPAVRDRQSIESLIASSQSNKARLLHYYPEPPGEADAADAVANDALCGTHVDHSILTGLCSAMYLSSTDGDPAVVPPPSQTVGLYIYPRGEPTGAVKVQIPPDCLAFQTGEALAVLTASRLSATPHFVSGNASTASSAVSRETYALFLQPDVDDVIGQDGETFGAFTKRVLGRHYAAAPREAED